MLCCDDLQEHIIKKSSGYRGHINMTQAFIFV